MANFPISMEKIKQIWHSQIHDEEKWATNMKFLKGVGMFVGSIIVMRNFEEMFAV